MLTLKWDEIPEEGLNLKWTEERAALLAYLKTFSQVDFDFESALSTEARIWKVSSSIFIKGKVEATLRLQCVRCLKEFSYTLSSTFELTLHPLKEVPSAEETELGEEEMESGFFEKGEIHLSEIACEQVFLEIPVQPLCQEGCKGLCSVCGRDLNVSSCTCVKSESPSSFSVLQKLKFDH
jgi:uncharacterized protein